MGEQEAGERSLEAGGRGERRRGVELEEAILDAAWDQVVESDGRHFTFESVARRAHTSKPVLYRRWPTRLDLVVATLRRRMEREPLVVPDTGSLRGDVLDVLHQFAVKRLDVLLVSGSAGSFLGDLHVTPDEVRRGALGPRRTVLEKVVEQARRRGEVGVELPSRVIAVPADLFRAEVVMTRHPVPDEVIEQIVDEVFLPLVRAYQAPPAEDTGATRVRS